MSDPFPSPADDTPRSSDASPSGTDWFFRRDQQTFGPMSLADLQRRVAAGKLKANDMVCRRGDSGWQRAETVPGLFTDGAAPETEVADEPEPPEAAMEETDADETAATERAPHRAKKRAKAAAKAAKPTNWTAWMGASCGLIVVLVVLLLLPVIAGVVIYLQVRTADAPAAPVVRPDAGIPNFQMNGPHHPQPAPPGNDPLPPVGEGDTERSVLKPPVDDEPAPKEPAPKQPMPKAPAPKQPMPKEPMPKEPAPKQAEGMPTGAAAFVFLERSEAPTEIQPGVGMYGILLREIGRQSLLTAREELRLTARDALLGEAPPPGMPEKNVLRVASTFKSDQSFEIMMTNGPKANAGLPSGQISKGTGTFSDCRHAVLAQLLEGATHTTTLAGLKRAGFTGKANRFLPMESAVPDGIEDLLGEMTLTAQYQAVRELHALIRKKGESPGRLGALVRAYANLGVLTEFQWDSAPKVFKARSLLYASRLVSQLPKDAPLGHWHRAYACALTGLHVDALDELKTAATLRGAGAGKDGKEPGFTPPPPWVELIDAYCRFDSARLKQAADAAKSARLAQLLWYFSVESFTCPTLTITVGQSVLETNPACFRVHDGICRVAPLGVRQLGTQRAPAVFAEHFPQRLGALPGVPPSVAKLASAGAPAPELSRALREAGNAGAEPCEFSWAVLGHLAREIHFAQLCQRLNFMRYNWSVPTAEFANEALPSVAGHPYEPFIRSFTVDRYREVAKCRELLGQLPLADLGPVQLGVVRACEECKAPDLLRVHQLCLLSMDMIDYDVRVVLPWMAKKNPTQMGKLAKGFDMIAPYSPISRGTSVENRWDEVSQHAEEWEKQAQHPVVLIHLGQRYTKLNRSADAVRCLERAIAMSPEFHAYKLLAGAYKVDGNVEKWQAALDRYLEHEALGLEAARVRVEIANELMRLRHWKKAQPYADGAAATGADWAMQCACACYTGLGEWETAEQWIRRSTERYENSYTLWFMWCKRTGKGDLAAASKVVTDRFQDVSQIAAPIDLQNMGIFYTLTGRSEQALWAYRALHKALPTGDVPALLALLAEDENENRALRDKIINNFPEGSGKGPHRWLPIVYREALARGEKAKLDLDAADKHMAGMPVPLQPVGAYFVGRFLEQHGHKADAIRYYRRCVDAPEISSTIFSTLAITRLRALGVKDEPPPGRNT